jgi:nitrogen fixation NifU-like protein
MAAESVMDHFESPRNVGEVENADATARGSNPVCGDEVSLSLRLEGGVVGEARFRARACHATVAVMSLLTERIRGLSADRAAGIDPDEIVGWFADFPAGKRHAAEVAAEVLRRALGSGREGGRS